jgi:hypothetical protein
LPTPGPTATPTPQTGTLLGLITDAGNGARLAGVTVLVAGQSLVTDERGFYRFEGLPEGLQTVTAEKEGYHPAQSERVVAPGESRWNSFSLAQVEE